MLTAVLGKVNYWHSTREIIWKIGFLQDRVKKFRLYLLNQCISEENQGWLQNDRELKILENWKFLRKWGTVCENSSYGSGLMAEYVLLTQVLHIYFLDSRPQDQELFWDFIILLDSYHDSWENEVLFVKIGTIVLDLWLDTSSWHKWPKCSF